MDFAEAAAAFRKVAVHCEESLALDAARAAADVALVQMKIVTPVLSGALRDSEHVDAVSGDGIRAQAVLAPHTIYAHFRDQGGTITSKGPWPLRHRVTGQVFGRHVTQAGAHYMDKSELAGRGPAAEAVSRVAVFYITL